MRFAWYPIITPTRLDPNYNKFNSHKFRRANPDYGYEKVKEWRLANPGSRTIEKAMRRAAERNAAPQWLTKQQKAQMAAFYKTARSLSTNTQKYHVDHIVPINGGNVSGLHVPWNLQILRAEENLKKSNKVNI